MAASVAVAAAHPDWKMHNTFDEAVTRVIDTPGFVYFTGRTQPFLPGQPYNSTEYLSLFRYDKENEEMESLSTDNLLSSNTVSCVEYSPEKKFLVVVHTDSGIDILYDDGKVANISAYMHATLSYDKTVSHIFIDPENDRVYLSTGFGFVALNDKKKEVADSRIYGSPIKSIARLGDRLLMLSGNRLLSTSASRPALGLTDLSEIATFDNPLRIYSVSPEICIVQASGGKPHALYKVCADGDAVKVERLLEGQFRNVERNSLGATFPSGGMLHQVHADGSLMSIEIGEADKGASVGSHDLREVWYGDKRKGIWSKEVTDGGAFMLTRDCILPDAPAPFMATEMVWHPERGLLVANHGYGPDFAASEEGGPLLLSAYKDGRWTNLSPVYANPGATEPLKNPNGLAVDPDNPDLVYFGSLMCGMERINMADATDVIHLSRKNDPYKGLPGFVPLVADQTGNPSPLPGVDESWAASCPFAAPEIDAYGNLWTAYADYDDQRPFQLHLICWTADDRRASTSASSVRLPRMVKVEGIIPCNKEVVVPLLYSGRKDYLAYAQRNYDGGVYIIDTNGTPTETADDRIAALTTFTDQDGTTFDVHNIRFLWEDPSSGNVWVGHGSGVFHFNPARLLEGDQRVTRIKVARGDGTNLADYLLDGVPVSSMTVDGAGRKWFATGGAGVVCTSADGREIKEELTSAGSPLPDDFVLGLGYVPPTNSMMISTRLGIAEYFMRGPSSAEGDSSVRVYPNPVRPDYYGYVNIDGLPDGTLVKIVDASGNIVKELGVVNGGKARWDVTNLGFKRVSSGVYFVLGSSVDEGNDFSTVGKILVIN